MESLINTIVGYLWSDVLVFLALGIALYFTIITRGAQFRHFPEMFRLIREKKELKTGISSKQALFMALASRIGVGNIAGVSIAVGAGGPGAVFWMIVMGFLGGALAFAESSLAQLYKTKENDEYRGGLHYYVGLKYKTLGLLAAFILAISYTFLLPGIQMNTITSTFESTFSIPPVVTGLLVTALTGIVIWGGARRIGSTAEKLVPFMSVIYLLSAITLLIVNYDQVPATFKLIIDSAFGRDAVFGAIVGYSISMGVRRSVFASTAGAGEGTFTSAAAMVSHPVKQGLVQAFSIIFETIFILTSSGLIILITQTYNVVPPGAETALVEHVPGVAAGAQWTSLALQTIFHQAGAWFLAFAIFLFAFTTLITNYYIAETAVAFFDKEAKYPIAKKIAKVIGLIVLFYGSINSTKMVWAMGDIAFGALAYVNLIALVLLSKPLLKLLRDYEKQLKEGKNPVFDPQTVGIEKADYWDSYMVEHNKLLCSRATSSQDKRD